MKVDAKEILERLKKGDSVRRSFYVSKSVYAEFQRTCGKASVSAVLEEFVWRFSEFTKEKKSSGR